MRQTAPLAANAMIPMTSWQNSQRIELKEIAPLHTNRTIAVLTLMAIASLSAAADEPYTKRVRPLIEQYCLACHSTEKKLGELVLVLGGRRMPGRGS